MEREESTDYNFTSYVDCLTCNTIKEIPVYEAGSICTECGDKHFIT